MAGWGRVYVVEALCRRADRHPDVQDWLLRRAVDGDFLNGYFAGKVARATRLHEALSRSTVDAEIVNHAGNLLLALTFSQGMGTTLANCPHADELLAGHLSHLERLGPSPERYYVAALLVRSLGEGGDEDSIAPVRRWQPYRDGYRALLDRDDWCATARKALADGNQSIVWLAETASDSELRAFPPSR